ncbi:zinc metallopeptidase, partial [Staphylococcus epidermidis]|uniref:zinc metallopeptidase n=1 Tax=Staphylococcus epidermidis TaxID=1282 RepID=UPI00164262E4
MSIIIYFLILILIPISPQHKLKSNYQKYSQLRSTTPKTPPQLPQQILHSNPIYHLDLLKPQRFLTHHYHPNKKLLSLSPPNYDRPS